jgi:16S rRNA (guanine966-N2)-methyltransferase
MRIVAGDHRGRSLVAPKGHSTRPTADRTRQALFNVLEHAPWSPGFGSLRIIDLFAGSGALGIEGLSRGADFCLFLDKDPAAQAAISTNIETLKLSERCRVDRRDAVKLGDRGAADGPAFGLAFLDPPYARGLEEDALASLAEGRWMSPGAVVVVERGADEAPLIAPGYERLDDRSWGAARVWFLRAPT